MISSAAADLLVRTMLFLQARLPVEEGVVEWVIRGGKGRGSTRSSVVFWSVMFCSTQNRNTKESASIGWLAVLGGARPASGRLQQSAANCSGNAQEELLTAGSPLDGKSPVQSARELAIDKKGGEDGKRENVGRSRMIATSLPDECRGGGQGRKGVRVFFNANAHDLRANLFAG